MILFSGTANISLIGSNLQSLQLQQPAAVYPNNNSPMVVCGKSVLRGPLDCQWNNDRVFDRRMSSGNWIHDCIFSDSFVKVPENNDDANSGPLDLRVTTHSIDVGAVSSHVPSRHNFQGTCSICSIESRCKVLVNYCAERRSIVIAYYLFDDEFVLKM